MTRKQRDQKRPTRRPKALVHKQSAAGYLKRHAHKTKPPNNISDVYEYQPEQNRRSKITLEVGKDEGIDLDHDSSDGGEDGHLKARLVGEQGDDEKIDSGDDEEIDSDDAFEESDEEKYAGHQFSHINNKKSATRDKTASGKGVQYAEVDLDESEDIDGKSDGDKDEETDAEEGDAREFIDVLDILDGKGEACYENETGIGHKDATEQQESNGSVEEDGAGDEDEDNADSESDEESGSSTSPLSDAEDVPEALDELENFITNLDPGIKRKSTADPDHDARVETRPRKRRMIEERTEAGVENEFYAQISGKVVDLNDLLAPLTSKSADVLSLKASAKALASSSKTKTLPAPLPQRTQERLDREAAYEQTKEEVDKWSATMKRIKEAEHLSFPLQAQDAGRTSTSELTAKFKPTTELETSIDRLLKSAKMREEDIKQTEELKMNHLSVEEVAARREELRTMRELLFRAEVKAKRIAKIKSKTYRRIRKREKAKLATKVDEEVDEEDESVRMKREMDRARERATLRHKNTGKWAKAMKARGELDIDERAQISEMLERGDLLRKKIRGDRGSGDESEGESDDGDGQEDVEGIKARAFEELAGLEEERALQSEGSGKRRSVFDMKFMKNAMSRDQQQVDQMVDDFVKEIGGDANEGSEAEHVQGIKDLESNAIIVKRTGGRVAYRPGSNAPLLPKGSLASDTSSVTLKSTDPLPPPPPPISPELPAAAEQQQPIPLPIIAETNPWLVRDVAAKAPRKKKNEVVVGKDSASAEKSKNRLKKQANKLNEEKAKARDDAQLEISISNVLTLGDTNELSPLPAATTPQAEDDVVLVPVKGKPSVPTTTSADDSDADNSEVEEQEKALAVIKAQGKGKGEKKKGLQAFEQRDLVALAFAGDNVVKAFQDAKRREVTEDAPREVDTTLPGWGSWGGTGTRRQPPKPHLIKKIPGVDPKSRADYQKAHVIISEKQDKKAAKYMVKDLPFPYTSKAQFERSLERPLGTEWNTRVGFQRGTLPKVVKKMGTIIDPLEKLF